MSSPSGSGTTYVPYQSKRNSTASIASLSGAVAHRQLGGGASTVAARGGSSSSSASGATGASSYAITNGANASYRSGQENTYSPQPFRPSPTVDTSHHPHRRTPSSPPPLISSASASASASSSAGGLASAGGGFPSASSASGPSIFQQRPCSNSAPTSGLSSRNRSPERPSSANPARAPSSPLRVQSPSQPPASGAALRQRVIVQQQPQQRVGNGAGRGARAYHPKFQPQGVRRDRTEEFMNSRNKRGERTKLDEGRLARRLEKLVALHFPTSTENEDERGSTPTLTPLSLATSTFATLSSLRGKSAKEIWASVAGARGEIEREEQAIVKWQEDAEAKFCPICMAPFGIKTRRHHCRLCGRVVCFLPPTPLKPLPPYSDPGLEPPIAASTTPIRRERCSTFFTYEHQRFLIGGEKTPIGVVVEIEPVEIDLSFGAVVPELTGGAPPPPKEKDERKKVRVCRDCLNTVLRQQLKTLPVRTPTWLKLYEVLVQLEQEIEKILPEFQELALGLQNSSTRSVPAATSALNLRKRLLTDLASYDTIAKRIRDLPLLTEIAQPGGSQDRLQQAIASRATLFLQEKLSLLRSLGDLDDLDGSKTRKVKAKATSSGVKTLAGLLGDAAVKGADRLMSEKVGVGELEVSEKLKVLLEQEALVRTYVEDANAKRQFEDAASLQMSLKELQEEIRQLRLALP
ncbi:BQ2448_5575 [Microbotryum intermedium]|uniref:BQ2448_5575 protein n=1 Tax=Microbotryum intermedium TaxID=269621 RepID=A0A238F2J5_9BASI|nr:BQ2448_5575 [Microbotryum intermedium]